MLGPARHFGRSATNQSLRSLQHRRTAATQAQKREGTIADAFASLSGQSWKPLEPRFADVKQNLIRGNEDAVQESWERLLLRLKDETRLISQLGSKIIPELEFADIDRAPEHFNSEYRKRGVAVIRNVVPQEEALQMKEDIKQYIKANPSTKAFPSASPQVYELYWSPAQIRARSHPNLLKAQKFLLSFWHSNDPHALISTEPVAYADRLRLRRPGDAKFALGPHIDGGGCERWELEGYGKGGVYDKIFQGKWEDYDPWEASCRLPVESDLYQGAGACSAFRMAQGWLSMSRTGPYEGTLLVNPLLSLATAYFLLRPFFTPKESPAGLPSSSQSPSSSSETITPSPSTSELTSPSFLAPSNWSLETPTSSWLHGATPGHGQELRSILHPHLRLEETMVHVPLVQPGDYVAWNTDTIHAVDKIHAGKADSSVLYIPSCPLTERNAEYLARQRDAFLKGIPGPDFPGGVGESSHVGRPGKEDVRAVSEVEGMRAFGLEKWDSEAEGLSPGERKIMRKANEILGFN